MRLPRPRPLARNSAAAWAFALGVFLLSLAIRAALTKVAETGSPYLAFIPAIILATYFSGAWPGIVCGVLSLLSARYFFGVPPYSFSVNEANALGLGLFVAVAAINIAIVTVMRLALEQLDSERARSAALAEQRETLFRELQHRVSNNLAIVSALLNLQRGEVADERARHALNEASNRLALISRIHRKLHDPAGSQRRFGPFMEELCRDVLDASGASGIDCRVSAAANAEIPTDKLVPVSLIVTELVSNALEHGLADRPGGAIRVDLNRDGANHILTVSDNGKGLPPDFSPETNGGLGLRIVQALVQQVSGSFTMENSRGTTCRVVFDPTALSSS